MKKKKNRRRQEGKKARRQEMRQEATRGRSRLKGGYFRRRRAIVDYASIGIRMKWTEIEQKRCDENCVVDEDGRWKMEDGRYIYRTEEQRIPL